MKEGERKTGKKESFIKSQADDLAVRFIIFFA